MSFFRNIYLTGIALSQTNNDDASAYTNVTQFSKSGKGIVVDLYPDGTFRDAWRIAGNDKDENGSPVMYLYPSSEISRGRTGSSTRPHGMADQLQYVCAVAGKERMNEAYLAQLEDWSKSEFTHPYVNIIYKYVAAGTALQDISRTLGTEEKPFQTDSETKTFVFFKISGGDDGPEETWRNTEIMDLWEKYLESKNDTGNYEFDAISGEKDIRAENCDKNLMPGHANAKMFSCSSVARDLVWGGRFEEKDEAFFIGKKTNAYISKAMRFLFNGERYNPVTGTGVWVPITSSKKDVNDIFAVWRVSHPETFVINPASDGESLDPDEWYLETFGENIGEAVYGKGMKEIREPDTICAAYIGAISPGRLAVRGYYEFANAAEYVEKLNAWNRACSWEPSVFELDKGRKEFTPTMGELLLFLTGTYDVNAGRMKITDDGYASKIRKEVVLAKMTNGKLPDSLAYAAKERLRNPWIYKDSGNGKLSRTCLAVLRKYYIDTYGKEYNPMLNREETDRGYLYGRLLAIYDKMEKDTFDKGTNRPTNAAKMRARYAERPVATVAHLDEQARTLWLPGNKCRVRYEKELQEITGMIETHYGIKEKPLPPTYFFGYYAEMRDLWSREEKETVTTNNTASEEE